MAIFGNAKRARIAERQLAEVRAIVPDGVLNGRTVTSPYVAEAAPPRKSVVPWRRWEQSITEAASSPPPQAGTPPKRQGYMADIPYGGATEFNQGYNGLFGVSDRETKLQQLRAMYTECPWVNACVNAIARFSAAGGMSIVPDDETKERKETVTLRGPAAKAQALFDYINPRQNFRQLLRMVFMDLLIYGDSFIEVVWALGEPVALYTLPCKDMLIDSDEHGVVNFYIQRTETNRRAQFDPHEVIHIQLDSPDGGLYGFGPTEASLSPVETWLYTEGLLRSTMKLGNPPEFAVSWDANLDEPDIRKYGDQYVSRNLGPQNIGNLIEFRGQTQVHELGQRKIEDYKTTKADCRDEICATFGCPPAEVTVIESGNIGGGTGTSQRKTFQINTCGPLQETVLEALTFSIVQQGFGIYDHRCDLEEVDYRDDETIETVRTNRVERAGWTINRYRDDIGEPPVDGGDDAVIIQTRDVVLVKDLAAMSEAAVEKAAGPGAPLLDAQGNPIAPTVPDIGGNPPPPAALPGAPSDNQDPKHASGGPKPANESLMTEAEIELAWRQDFTQRLRQARISEVA